MKLCVSQFRSGAELELNLRGHVEVSRRAADIGCDLVLFPELSLTGYAPARAQARPVEAADGRLGQLQDVCDAFGITIACGAPLRADSGVEIGLIVFEAGRAPRTYAKQRLHADETPGFVPGTRELRIHRCGHCVAPGICFESVQPSHVAAAVDGGATLYAASVAKSASAMAEAHRHYAAMARRHAIPIVVSNAVGTHEGFTSGGRSAAWDGAGRLVGSLAAADPGELIVTL